MQSCSGYVSRGEDTKGEIGGELRHRLISEAAARSAVTSTRLELDDWLEAEAAVDRNLGGQRATH